MLLACAEEFVALENVVVAGEVKGASSEVKNLPPPFRPKSYTIVLLRSALSAAMAEK